MSANVVLGVFFTIVLLIVVFLMFRDWDDSKPGRQNFNHRKGKNNG